MLVLVLDTAGPDCAVALARMTSGRTNIIAERRERIGRGHAERLMPLIETVLAETNASFTDLQRVAVTAGPGSFTGVRIGIAAARGLALALNIPAIGIGSLEALAFGAAQGRDRGTIIAANDARRDEIYASGMDVASKAEILPLVVTAASAFAQRIAPLVRAPLVLVGSAAPALAPHFPPDTEIAGTAEAPGLAIVADLASAGRGSRPPRPLYVRGADAKPQAHYAVARL